MCPRPRASKRLRARPTPASSMPCAAPASRTCCASGTTCRASTPSTNRARRWSATSASTPAASRPFSMPASGVRRRARGVRDRLRRRPAVRALPRRPRCRAPRREPAPGLGVPLPAALRPARADLLARCAGAGRRRATRPVHLRHGQHRRPRVGAPRRCARAGPRNSCQPAGGAGQRQQQEHGALVLARSAQRGLCAPCAAPRRGGRELARAAPGLGRDAGELVFLHADICRRELDIEIEGHAWAEGELV